MSRLLLPLLLLSLCASAQTLHKHEDEKQPPPVTLHAGADLVVVDVVVTDKSHNPVTNLKPEDFVLTEDSHPQAIASFEEHTPAPPAKPQNVLHLPPGTFTNYTLIPPNTTLNVLLLDTLNTPATDQIYLHDQLRKFLNTAKQETPIAIFGLTDHLLLLQGFTANPELLKAVINNKKLKVSPLLEGAVNQGNTAPLLSDELNEFAMGAGSASAASITQTVANVQEFEAQQSSMQSQLRAKNTLDAMDQLARYLSGIPGHKNLIWFSGSFPLDILPDGSINHPFLTVSDSETEYRETTNLLTRAQVAVYPVDVRGAMTSPIGDVSQDSSIYVADNPSKSPARFADDLQKYHSQTDTENLTMLRLANDSGGHAFLNENDLANAVSKAIAAGSSYYTLSYTPTNPDWNGAFRKIQVKLAERGLTLAYRRGYYADRPDNRAGKTVVSSRHGATAQAPSSPMRIAMMRGAPDATQITLKARILPANSSPELYVAKGNLLTVGTKGPYQRYIVDLIFAPSDIAFLKTPDGHYHLDLDVLSAIYNRDGAVLNTEDSQGFADFSPEAYKKVIRLGVPIHQEISVPIKGDFFLRVGIHDRTTGRIGTVEIPIDAVKGLPPA